MKNNCYIFLRSITLTAWIIIPAFFLMAQTSHSIESERVVGKIAIRQDQYRLSQDSLNACWRQLAVINGERILQDWWPAYKDKVDSEHLIDFGYLENNSKTGEFGPETKGGIRPAAQNAYAVAVCLFTGIYDDQTIGVPTELAVQMVTTVIRSIAKDHVSNGGIGHSWGDQWQSSQWASKCAVSGWLLWDSFSVEEQVQIAKMIEHEADRLLLIDAPSANEKYVLNTHAEENGWDATCLQTAVGMMPDHARAKDWLEQSLAYRMNALATQMDLTNDQMIGGKRVREWINGYNLDTLGALGNHQAYPHPDYMASPLRHAVEGAIFLKLGKVSVPDANFFNCEKVYANLTDHSWEQSGIIYQMDGRISWPIDQEQDWRFEYMTYGLVDAGASLFGYDPGKSSVTATSWEEKHCELALNSRMTAFTSATAYLLHWLSTSDGW